MNATARLLLLGLGLAIVACGPGPAPSPSPSPSPVATPADGAPTPTPTINAPVGTIDPSLDGILQPILEDAYARYDLGPAQVVVLRAESAIWADASLGCAEPDIGYPDVETPGYWVQLNANGIPLDYRVGSDGGFRLCTIPSRDREPPVG